MGPPPGAAAWAATRSEMALRRLNSGHRVSPLPSAHQLLRQGTSSKWLVTADNLPCVEIRRSERNLKLHPIGCIKEDRTVHGLVPPAG